MPLSAGTRLGPYEIISPRVVEVSVRDQHEVRPLDVRIDHRSVRLRDVAGCEESSSIGRQRIVIWHDLVEPRQNPPFPGISA